MNIPPKYEDVVAQLEAALGREEMESALGELEGLVEKLNNALGEIDDLQHRLTVAEQRAGELEGLLRDINDAPGGSQFKKHIDAALKPVAEGEGS